MSGSSDDDADHPAGRTRVAAYALATDPEARILLCRIAVWVSPEQVWTLPGGGLEFGEAPVDAVLRELEEESGLRGEVVALQDVSSRVFTPAGEPPLHAIRIMYRVRITGGTLRDELDGSTDTCAWLTPAEASTRRLGDLARRALAIATGADPDSVSGAADQPAGADQPAPDA